MEPGRLPDIGLIVALVLASAVLAGLARVLGLYYAIVLVLGGLALGFVPRDLGSTGAARHSSSSSCRR